MSSEALEDGNTPQADLRQNLRVPLIIQKIQVDAERPVFFGYSKNISRSGIFIATTNNIKLGEEVDLEIPLPAPIGKSIRCRCEVVWRRPIGKLLPFEPGIGFKFLDLPAEIAEQIESWIKEQQEEKD